MISLVLDTNVLISATFWYGASFHIIHLVEEGKVKLILSPQILQEYAEVLQYEEIQEKISLKGLECQMTIAKLQELSMIVMPIEKVNAVTDDPDDNAVLECAIAGNVNYIISQDNHLLSLGIFRGIKIVTPEAFLHSLS